MDIIVTPRLVLRSPTPADLQPLHEHILSDAAVMRQAFSGRPMAADELLAFFQRNFDHGASGRKLGVLTERATGDVIGVAGLAPCDVLGEPDYELGFVLRRSAWGRGYATEIGRGQIQYGICDLELRRVVAQVSPGNEASIAVLKRIGMQFRRAIEHSERGARSVYVMDSPT